MATFFFLARLAGAVTALVGVCLVVIAVLNPGTDQKQAHYINCQAQAIIRAFTEPTTPRANAVESVGERPLKIRVARYFYFQGEAEQQYKKFIDTLAKAGIVSINGKELVALVPVETCHTIYYGEPPAIVDGATLQVRGRAILEDADMVISVAYLGNRQYDLSFVTSLETQERVRTTKPLGQAGGVDNRFVFDSDDLKALAGAVSTNVAQLLYASLYGEEAGYRPISDEFLALTELLERAVRDWDPSQGDEQSPIKHRDAASIAWTVADALYMVGDDLGDRARSKEAIGYFRRAVNYYDKIALVISPVDTDWAGSRFNRGNVLRAWARAADDPSKCEEALKAYEAAQTVWTREANPERWADVQMERAETLRTWGVLTGDASKYDQAIRYLDEAIEVHTRDAAPQKWARIQGVRGDVLATWATGGGGVEKYEQAIAAYDDALTVRTRDAGVERWAALQFARGVALAAWGSARGLSKNVRASKFEQAIQAYDAAATVRTRETSPARWGRIQRYRGLALTEWAKASDDPSKFGPAVRALEDALAIYTRDETPDSWAQLQFDLGNTLGDWAKAGGGLEKFDQAMLVYDEAQTVFSRAGAPLRWANIQVARAITFADWAEMVPAGPEKLTRAIACVDQALEVFREQNAMASIERSEGLRAQFAGRRDSLTRQAGVASGAPASAGLAGDGTAYGEGEAGYFAKADASWLRGVYGFDSY